MRCKKIICQFANCSVTTWIFKLKYNQLKHSNLNFDLALVMAVLFHYYVLVFANVRESVLNDLLEGRFLSHYILHSEAGFVT